MESSRSEGSGSDYAQAGGYPIGIVATLTGLREDTIRAWERRHGLPQPARSVGGHRLYSPRDVALLRRAGALRAQGQTATAACAQALAEAAAFLAPAPSTTVLSAGVSNLRARLHDAALALDAGQVSALLAEAAALLDIEALWEHVVAPVLAQLGTDWEYGEASAAPEHLLSSLVHGRLSALIEAMPRLPTAPMAVLGSGPGERHDLGALMLALLLARSGWRVTFLGAETPAEALEEAIRSVRPQVVVSSATLPEHAEDTLANLRRIRERLDGQMPILAYGGPAFADVAEEPPLVRLTGDVKAARAQLAALI